MYLLAILGVALSGTMTTREKPIKGWAMGWLGLLLSMVGEDTIYGVDRFVFGIPELASGIGYMPVLVGVFGIAEVFNVLCRREMRPVIPRQIDRILPSLRLLKAYWKSTLRAGANGTFIGAIPGAGAQVASYISYSVGERVTGRRFSNGDFEGVACSEVAKNANIGGGLLPTVTLGVPGNSSSALVMAALSLHGIILGPNIQNAEPGFVYFLYAALLVASFCMYFCALALIRPSLYLLSMPSCVIMSSVVVVSIIGTFSTSYSMFDVLVMFISGLVGFWLFKQGYPFAPLVLGLILGGVADDNLRRTLLIYDSRYEYLLLSPVGLLLLVLVAASFYWGIHRSRVDARRSAESG